MKPAAGTLFLENVAQLPLWGQVRLLEVLQQGQHSPGAGHAGVRADVRVIGSSTVDLSVAMAQRAFLSSLYYYLKVIEIHVPPLRHRCQDIGPLAERYLATANATRASQGNRPPCHFSKEALQCLVEYAWPGNKLQLASVVAHAVLLTDGDEITPMQVRELLGEVVSPDDAETISVPLIGGLKDIERAVVAAMIQRCRGNKAEAARVLGLHRRELYRILQRKAAAKEDAVPPPALGPGAATAGAGLFLMLGGQGLPAERRGDILELFSGIKPPQNCCSPVKRVIHIPVIHNFADLGSLAESVRTHYLQHFGPAVWQQRERAVAELWKQIRGSIDALHLDFGQIRIYQDGLPLCGKEEQIVHELAGAGSLNHQLVLELMGKGAALVGTEDPQLLIREYQLHRRRMDAAGGADQSAAAAVRWGTPAGSPRSVHCPADRSNTPRRRNRFAVPWRGASDRRALLEGIDVVTLR